MKGFLDFIFYCGLSGIYDPDFMCTISCGINLNADRNSQITSIKCLSEYLEQGFEVELNWDLLKNLWELLINCEDNEIKLEVVSLINEISIGYLRELVDNIGELECLQTLQKLVGEQPLTVPCLKLILAVIEIYEPC